MLEAIHPPFIPTVADVERISSHDEPVVRNLQITQCYYELSSVLAARTGTSANWCTFATWASKQAGQTIRKEDLKRTLETVRLNRPEIESLVHLLKGAGARRDIEDIRRIVWGIIDPDRAIDIASEAIGRGNLKVFAEIGLAFARFYAALLRDSTPDDERIRKFCEGMRPGDPPDGQQLLRDAFLCYYRVLFENDLKRRAELLLLANIQIGLHEQTRLQPEIREALDAGVPDPQEVYSRLIKAVFPFGGIFARARLFIMKIFKGPTPLERAVEELVTAVRKHVRLIITEHLMTISLPGGERLRIGEDLTIGFSPSLMQITDPDLIDLLARIDPTPDSLSDSGAVDWADLPDRMHFIATFFRCYQERPNLLETPFLPDQVTAIKEGRLPEGTL